MGLLLRAEMKTPSVLISFTSSLFTALIVLNSLLGAEPSMGSFSTWAMGVRLCLVEMSEMSNVFLRNSRGGDGWRGGTWGSWYLGAMGLVTLLVLN